MRQRVQLVIPALLIGHPALVDVQQLPVHGLVGRPMLYGTSDDFLIQFGLNDLSELPNLEDFEDLMTS